MSLALHIAAIYNQAMMHRVCKWRSHYCSDVPCFVQYYQTMNSLQSVFNLPSINYSRWTCGAVSFDWTLRWRHLKFEGEHMAVCDLHLLFSMWARTSICHCDISQFQHWSAHNFLITSINLPSISTSWLLHLDYFFCLYGMSCVWRANDTMLRKAAMNYINSFWDVDLKGLQTTNNIWQKLTRFPSCDCFLSRQPPATIFVWIRK